ncbi:MAG: sugar phosphate nucleotidyltransferase [Candidatus Hodarchaeota archaeon]
MSLQKNKIIENIIAIILCAGEGTRISNFIHNIPKPLIEIYGKPILSHLIFNLNKRKLSSIIIITGHLRESIEEYISSLKKKDESLQNKILLLNSGNNYKRGPLYSFLSIIKSKSIIKKSKIYLVFPGDTYYESILLEEIFHFISNNPTCIRDKSIIFYQKMKAINLKTKLNPEKLISIAKIEKTKSKEIIVKELQQFKLSDISENEEINLIVPLFVFNHRILNKIIETERKISATTIKEIFNHINKQKNILYGVPIDPKYRFNDIDTKSDLLSLK